MTQMKKEEHVNQIYDKIFKKILTLSGPAVINLINGLFETNHPLDSQIKYHWTEFIDDKLRRVLADTIITVNDIYPYHIEAQIENDDDIVFRVFDYGYKHAEQNKVRGDIDNSITAGDKEKANYILRFPEPKIVYLNSSNSTPDKYTLKIDFGTQGSFLYSVNTFKFLDFSTEELNKKKMIVLIPFKLLALRKLISKERSPENLQALQSLIKNDILTSIKMNVEVGNISRNDGVKLQDMTVRLYKHIYSKYEDMEDIEDMTDESIMFPIDELEKKMEELEMKMAEQATTMAEQANAIVEKDNAIAEQANVIVEKDRELAKIREELSRLKKQLGEL